MSFLLVLRYNVSLDRKRSSCSGTVPVFKGKVVLWPSRLGFLELSFAEHFQYVLVDVFEWFECILTWVQSFPAIQHFKLVVTIDQLHETRYGHSRFGREHNAHDGYWAQGGVWVQRESSCVYGLDALITKVFDLNNKIVAAFDVSARAAPTKTKFLVPVKVHFCDKNNSPPLCLLYLSLAQSTISREYLKAQNTMNDHLRHATESTAKMEFWQLSIQARKMKLVVNTLIQDRYRGSRSYIFEGTRLEYYWIS